MGGRGSGRFFRPDRKITCEECLSLDSNKLTGIIKKNPDLIDFPFLETVTFINRNNKMIASVGFSVKMDWKRSATMDLHYVMTKSNIVLPIDDHIPLTTTAPYLGGKRWWFVCPQCKKMVGKIFLPPNEIHFRCRKCHKLTYLSCQESHRWKNFYRSIGMRMGKDPDVIKGKLWGIFRS